MSFTAGRVMVPVVPDLRGFQKTVAKGGSQSGTQFSQGFARSTSTTFGKLGGLATKSLKRGLQVSGIGATIAGGLAIKGGITRLMGIEDARASLAGLGHDAKSIDQIMANALKSVKGTAFGMADAGKVAASAVAAGVKPGKDLERTLKLTGDAATIAKVSFSEMGSIFGKVAASNKIQGDVIAQLNDQGIPIIQLLSKELGTSAEETVKLASQGKVNFATFQNAMETGLGGAAKKSGDTMRGSFANMNAALGRVGANLLSGFFPKVRGGFQGITKALGPMEDRATVAGQALGEFASKYGPPTVAVLKQVFGAIKDLVVAGARVVKFLWEYREVVAVLVVGLAAYKASLIATRVAETALALWRGRQLIAMYAVTVAQRAMNAAMNNNPIGRVITVLTLLAAGLVLAYKRSSTFRAIVQGAFAGIKTALAAAWGYIKPVLGALRDFFAKVIPPAVRVLQAVFKVVFAAIKLQVKIWWGVMKVVFSLLKAYLTNVLFPVIRFLYDKVVKPVFTAVGKVIGTVWNSAIKPVFSKLKSGVNGVKTVFSAAVDGIGKVWQGLKNIMRAPVNWVIRNVINKLIGAMNKIPKVNIGKVSEIGAASSETGSDRAAAARGGKGGRGGRSFGGKGVGGKGGKRTWPANTRALSGNYAGHSGIDIAAANGSPIRAASGGRVEYTGWGRGYGQAIMVRGDDGLLQIYGHSSSVSARAGQRVSAGDILGRVGSTGNSTGPHLHFEIAKGSPGSVGNRAATLAWLGGAKMGSGKGDDGSAAFNAAVNGVSAKGAPKNAWFDASALTSYLKSAAKSSGRRLLKAPVDLAKKGASLATKGVKAGLGVVGLGGIGGKSKKPTKAQRRAKKNAAKRKAAIRKQKRDRLKIARALPKTLSKSERSALMKQTSGLTIGNLASITDGFITGQISAVTPNEDVLKGRYSSAQAAHSAAADRKTAADRNLAIARANNQNSKSVKTGKALAKAERERAKAVKELSAAQKNATSAANAYRAAQDKAIERAANVRDSGIGLGSIGSASFRTAGGISSNLRKAVATTRTWGGVVSGLISAGLRGPILEEFINAGPSSEAVFTGKSLLASGQIGTINDLQNELRRESIAAASKASVALTGKGATGAGLAGSWSSSSAPSRSAVAVTAPGAAGSGLPPIHYHGMPSDTVESIAAKTSDRIVREFSRPGA